MTTARRVPEEEAATTTTEPGGVALGELRYLSRREVQSLLPGVGEQIALAEATFHAMRAGRVQLPPKPALHPRRDAFIHAMPAYIAGTDVAAVKWVSGYPANPSRGLPYISGLMIVSDPATGMPIAVLDAAEITAARTAAVSGVCIRRFAPPGWSRAAILGCGEQGRYHARVLAELNPDATIAAFDPVPERIAQLGSPRVEPAPDARSAVCDAEVVITAAPIVDDPEPAVAADWLAERVLLLPLDFDCSATASAVAATALLLSDDIPQFEAYREHGRFGTWRAPDGSVADALEGMAIPARVTCCNLGVGALDAAFANRVRTTAIERGVGTCLPL